MANELNPALGSPKLFPGLKNANAESPAMPQAMAGGQLTEESKNVFTELFGKDASQKNAAMMNTVVAQNDRKNISYFGAKPKTPELALKNFAKHSSRPGAAVLKASILVLFLAAFVFGTQTRSQLSIFGVNPALRLETVQMQVEELNAEVLVQKHLASALLLDEFSNMADEYLYARSQVESTYTSSNKREEYEASSKKLKTEIVSLLSQVQTKLAGEITPEETVLAVQVADELIGQLQGQSGSVDEQSLQQEIRDLQTTKALLQNNAFRNQMASLDMTALDETLIQSIFENFSTMNASLNATINSIQSTRIAWSLYLDEIESITKRVDPLFNTEFQSSLMLTDLILKEDGTVSVSGVVRTDDSKNFTLVSNLIDAFEASPHFEKVEERSYSKSEEEESYTSNFRLSMTLQTNPDSDE
ncbi:hypothetical protein IPG41_06200 [Candidatus Peregrinibacteria bacterium]|nr:MAG: hypothetical protein IPG41_06200 [Candidatus Peregrinibacteria bacterium]